MVTVHLTRRSLQLGKRLSTARIPRQKTCVRIEDSDPNEIALAGHTHNVSFTIDND